VSEVDDMYADAGSGRTTVYLRATFLREPYIGLRKFITRDAFEALADAGCVRAENIYQRPATSKPSEAQAAK
jgi:hypothetical protein